MDNVLLYLMNVGSSTDLTIRDVIAMLSTCKQLHALMDHLVVTERVNYTSVLKIHRPIFERVHAEGRKDFRGAGFTYVPEKITSLTLRGVRLFWSSRHLFPDGEYMHYLDSLIASCLVSVQGDERSLNMPRITELELVDCTIDDLRFLVHFPNLKILTLSSAHGGHDYHRHDHGIAPYPIVSAVVSLPKLVELQIHNCSVFGFESLMKSAPNLKKISVVNSVAHDLLHEGVTELHYTSCFLISDDIDLDNFPNLRSLYYTIPKLFDNYKKLQDLIQDIIEYAPSSLRKLVVTASSLDADFEPPDSERFEFELAMLSLTV
jgi:hypothetical protein